MADTEAKSGRWIDVLAADTLTSGSMRVVKVGDRQLVLLRDGAGVVHALDNRCPHEGYPLAQGDLQDCILTCAWHNWKFDVRDGKCVLGGEDVHRWQTRERDGRIELEWSEPDPTAQLPRWRASLEQALFEGDVDWALRDCGRLLHAGLPATRLLADLAVHDARHQEYGTSHVLPLAADVARSVGTEPLEDQLTHIAEVVALCVDSAVRMPRRPLEAPRKGGQFDDLERAVEAQDEAAAEAILRGALRSPNARPLVEGWLYRLITAHFLDFGHPLIYLVKAQELLDRTADDVAAELYPALLRRIVVATREDTLPYFRTYREAWAEYEPKLGVLFHAAGRTPAIDRSSLRDRVLLGDDPSDAVHAVAEALESGARSDTVGGALAELGAELVRDFDTSIDARDDVAEGWLWVTHRFTFAAAARLAQTRAPHPHSLRLLFQSAAFLHQGRVLREAATTEVPLPGTHRADAATAESLASRAFQVPWVLPIFRAHAIKFATAATEEANATTDPQAREVFHAAADHFLGTAPLERNLRAASQRALDTVLRGRPPRRLTQ